MVIIEKYTAFTVIVRLDKLYLSCWWFKLVMPVYSSLSLRRHRRAATSLKLFRSRSHRYWARSSRRQPHCWLAPWTTRWNRSKRPGEGGLWYWWPDATMRSIIVLIAIIVMLVIITCHNIEIRPGDGCTPLIRPDNEGWPNPNLILPKLNCFATTAEDLDWPSKSQNVQGIFFLLTPP